MTAMPALAGATVVPHFDHVVVVIMENHSYAEVRNLPYVSSLIAGGLTFGNSYGVTHPSQPNYLALWSGSVQGVTNDTCPPKGAPYAADNLGHACEAAGLTWRAYSEDLPAAGYTGCSSTLPLYARKHAPWVSFSNVDHAKERPMSDLAAAESLGTLPSLAFVIPNQCHDGHDCGNAVADAWLAAWMPGLIQAAGAHGLVILTWDEDDASASNQILTVFAGPRVQPGLLSMQHLTHYTVLRTICDGLGLAPLGAAAAEVPVSEGWAPATSDAPAPLRAVAWLGPPSPNPSHGVTTLRLWLPREADVQATVFDLAGRRVRALAADRRAGETALSWDGRADDGNPTRHGVYILQVRAGDVELRRKLIRAGFGARAAAH